LEALNVRQDATQGLEYAFLKIAILQSFLRSPDEVCGNLLFRIAEFRLWCSGFDTHHA
jgi:hypothetical protein